MRIRTLIFALSIFASSGSFQLLPAQSPPKTPDLMDMSLEDLMNVEINSVYGASKYKQNVASTPASITIITGEEIKRYGYRTLADILRDVPGFYVTYDRSYSYVGVRGFGRPGDYNTRVLLLVDGHRINDNIDDQAFLGTDFPVDLDLIDRVEIIRGPNSSVYVASALLGIINVVTKHDMEGVTFAEEAVSYGGFKSNVSYGRLFKNGLHATLSGTYFNRHGQERLYFPEFDDPSTNNGIAQNVDHGRVDQLFANLTWGNFSLEGVYASRLKQIPTASFDSIFNDPESHTIDKREYLDLQYDRRFGTDWGVFAHVSYDRYPFDFMAAYDLSVASARAVNRETVLGEWWGTEAAVSKKILSHQTVIVGGEYRDNFRQTQKDFLIEPYMPLLASQEQSSASGVYVQDEIPIGRQLILDVGLRYDHYSTFGGTTNPRAALIYKPLENTTFKLLYGQSYRAPNDTELYFQVPGSTGQTPVANPNLKPETARTTELVVERNFRRDFHIVASAYYYPICGLISAVNDPASGAIIYENSQRVHLKGLEFTLKRQSKQGIEAGLSLTFEHATDADTGQVLSNSPGFLGQANLSVPLFHKKIIASTNLEYVSSRRTLNGELTGAYLLPNVTLVSPGALRHLEISASIYNAFNAFFVDPGSVEHRENVIPQDGRDYRIALMYHF